MAREETGLLGHGNLLITVNWSNMSKFLGLCALLFSTFVFASERAQQAWDWIDSGAVVIDVRTPQEFASGHLDNAINLPVQNLAHADLSFLKNRDQLVVYCRSGNRSAKAQQLLLTQGYKQVHNGGGLQEMLSAKPE